MDSKKPGVPFRDKISMFLPLSDALLVILAPVAAVLVHFAGAVDADVWQLLRNDYYANVLISLSVFYSYGLYNRLWRYAGIPELLRVTAAVTVNALLQQLYFHITNTALPLGVAVISWLLNMMFIGGSRMMVRIVFYLRRKQQSEVGVRVLIIGAGAAGAMIAREIGERYYGTKHLTGFLDDDPQKQDQWLVGAKVLGSSRDIVEVVRNYGIHEIIIAIPSGGGVREIIQACKQTRCVIKTVPDMSELIDGKVTINQLREVALEDLLRRDPVQLDRQQISRYLTGKRVLVTGAGGSIGSELCRQIARMEPEVLVVLGKGENSIYEINQDLMGKYPRMHIEPVIADVQDDSRIRAVFMQFQPQVVFHAAAHKHVPLMEAQPREAVHNNILGTKVLAHAAHDFAVEIFIMVSTDKAVNPTSVMGATKRVAELVVQALNRVSSTRFAAVRFGNVLGSRGSVIPLFRKQIAGGGPVTITHPEMIRYFMTIPEAAQLVLQAGALTQGGEVFVLDMGKPVKILDMAMDLIVLSGLRPNDDIKIEFTGLRPGEKLYEELLTAEEGTAATLHEKIFVASYPPVDERKLWLGLGALEKAVSGDEVRRLLADLLPTYRQSCAG